MEKSKRKGVYNAADFGIDPDNKPVTAALNNAISELSANGGGELVFSAGTYFTGTVVLASNITLRLSAGARLRSTGNLDDYLPDDATGGSIFEGEENMGTALIFGEGLKNVAIVGQGVIDGNGIAITAGDKAHLYPEGHNYYGLDNYEFLNTRRPFTLKLNNCENVTIEGVRFVNSASWNVGMNRCRDVFVRGVDIKSRNFYNGDGLDFNSCERVYVSDCTLDCTDDCIAIQSAYPDSECKNIFIKGCTFTSILAGVRIGMACLGSFGNITVSDCVFENCGCSGLKVQQCEGGVMENFVFRGLIMKNVAKPFFFTHNSYACTKISLRKPDMKIGASGIFRNIIISDCILENDRRFENGGIIFDSEDGFEISDVTLENIRFGYVSSEADGDVRKIGALKGKRPETDVYNGSDIWGAMLLRNCRRFCLRNAVFSDKADSRRAAALINCRDVLLDGADVNGSGKEIVCADCENVVFEKSPFSSVTVRKI